jgi:hypothetical protein
MECLVEMIMFYPYRELSLSRDDAFQRNGARWKAKQFKTVVALERLLPYQCMKVVYLPSVSLSQDFETTRQLQYVCLAACMQQQFLCTRLSTKKSIPCRNSHQSTYWDNHKGRAETIPDQSRPSSSCTAIRSFAYAAAVES